MKEFRDLRADEIDCRIATVSEKGVSLLLYKSARADMNILDETVGPLNWMRSHCRENANCIVSIWDDDKKQWVSKEDTGTESFTEAEKGLASDSFKRACFNWGIGRELYTAPFIWIKAGDCRVFPNTRAKSGFDCRDRFTVTDVEIKDKKIVKLVIRNDSTDQQCFIWASRAATTPAIAPVTAIKRGGSTLEQLDEITAKAEQTKTNIANLLGAYGAKALVELTFEQANAAIDVLNEKVRRQEERNAKQG